MKKECACQDQEVEEGGMEEDEEAEQDEMLFEYAGEVLPNLGRAMTPDTFAPYFAGLFQVRTSHLGLIIVQKNVINRLGF